MDTVCVPTGATAVVLTGGTCAVPTKPFGPPANGQVVEPVGETDSVVLASWRPGGDSVSTMRTDVTADVEHTVYVPPGTVKGSPIATVSVCWACATPEREVASVAASEPRARSARTPGSARLIFHPCADMLASQCCR